MTSSSPRCVDCGSDLLLGTDRPDLGEIVICPECGVELEVVALEPLELLVIAEDDSAEGGASD